MLSVFRIVWCNRRKKCWIEFIFWLRLGIGSSCKRIFLYGSDLFARTWRSGLQMHGRNGSIHSASRSQSKSVRKHQRCFTKSVLPFRVLCKYRWLMLRVFHVAALCNELVRAVALWKCSTLPLWEVHLLLLVLNSQWMFGLLLRGNLKEISSLPSNWLCCFSWGLYVRKAFPLISSLAGTE